MTQGSVHQWNKDTHEAEGSSWPRFRPGSFDCLSRLGWVVIGRWTEERDSTNKHLVAERTPWTSQAYSPGEPARALDNLGRLSCRPTASSKQRSLLVRVDTALKQITQATHPRC